MCSFKVTTSVQSYNKNHLSVNGPVNVHVTRKNKNYILETVFPQIIPGNVFPRLELGEDALKNCSRKKISKE